MRKKEFDPGDHKDSVAKGATYIFFARVVMLLCGLILQITLARLLGVVLYGLYGLIFSLLIWFELFMMGIGRASSMQVAKSSLEARDFCHVAIKVQVTIASILIVLSIGTAFLFPVLFNRPGTAHYFIVAFLDIPLIGFFYLFQGIINGLRLYLYQAIDITVYYIARLVFSILLVELGFSLMGAIIANLICSVAGICFALHFLHKKTANQDEKSTIKASQLFKFTVPFMILPLVFNVLVFSNLWLVGALLDPVDLGIYNASFNLSRILLVLFDSMATALFPAIAASFYYGDSSKSSSLIRQSLRFLLLFVTPTCFFLGFTSGTVLKIFGSSYTAGSGSMALLLVAFFFLTFVSIFNYIMMASSRFWMVITINLFAVSVEITAAVPLISRYGKDGAAVSLIVACATALTIQLYLISRQYGSPITLGTIIRVMAAGGVSGALLLPVRSIWLLIPVYSLCFCFYIFLVVFLGELKTEELKHWFRVITRA